MNRDDAFKALWDALQTRPRPEDVAEIISQALTLGGGEKRILDKAAKNSLSRNAWGYTSMARDFSRPVGADKQVKTAAELFKIPDPPTAAQCMHPEVVDAFLKCLAPTILAIPGMLDFKANRLNRAQRHASDLTINHRQYNKRFRVLGRMEEKLQRMIRNSKKYAFTRISKSALATQLSFEEFSKDLPTAAFLAYLSARMSVRSVFTNASQERAFDEISQMLLHHAKTEKHANWWAIAHVHPEREILEKLSDEEKGKLLGMTFAMLKDIADFLGELHSTTNIDRETLIVRRGNDSTTWNQTAGAWNKARDHWISLVYALGMDDILDVMCPGKVLRLMAADVVGWHAHSKGGIMDALHPDTKVWRDLPAPWEVLAGKAACPRKLVLEVCARNKVEPKGWGAPRPDKQAVAFKPTPELVHGVAVANPHLAKVLRQHGAFSGQGLRGDSVALFMALSPGDIVLDEAGAVVQVNSSLAEPTV